MKQHISIAGDSTWTQADEGMKPSQSMKYAAPQLDAPTRWVLSLQLLGALFFSLMSLVSIGYAVFTFTTHRDPLLSVVRPGYGWKDWMGAAAWHIAFAILMGFVAKWMLPKLRRQERGV